MTKPPPIAAEVANLFHPQTGEECIIQPRLDALRSKQFQTKKLPEPPLTAFFTLGLYVTPGQHILILYVYLPYLCSHLSNEGMGLQNY